MKKDYLTDKGRADNEVRELEELLSVFRHNPEAVLRLPENEAAEKPAWNWNFSFSLATAASLVVVATLSIFIQSDRKDTAHTYPGGRQETAALDSHSAGHETSPPASPRIQTVEPLDASVEELRPRRKPRQRASPFKKSRVLKTPGPTPLTDEERYAYQQLKLALAITSSKLKIVKDSINGVNEHPNAALDTAR